jgi:hypothetical protein
MVNRRTTLLGLAAAAGAGLSRAAFGTPQDGKPAGPRPPQTPAPAGDTALRDDLARMGSHEYSDEGIPVFLACVDLVAEKAGKPAVPAPPLGRHLASELRRYGDAWHRLHPDAPDTDVSKVLEVLAERDFAQGGAP